MRPLESSIALLLILGTLGLFLETPTTSGDFTDTGVGCVDDCLEPLDTSADAEPINPNQED